MNLTVVGVRYENTKTGELADDIIVLGNSELSDCDLDIWLCKLYPRYCSKIARKKGFDDYRFMFWNRCKASEVEREIQEMREELNDFWQLAYELGERVPSSFVPDKSGN